MTGNKLTSEMVQGFTLIEILVAVLVLSIGLLGMASLQLLGSQSSQGAASRTQAALLAYDLAERMRNNRDAALNGSYGNGQLAAPNDPACIFQGGGCNPDQLAAHDIREWLDHIVDVNNIGLDGNNWQPTIAGATASLAQNNNQFTLTINWQETDSGSQQLLQRSYEMGFEI
ncbi:type IV pilus modification protein PilV [Endozoicomonas sp. ALC020]|uniref:type IV pilus modification protein PilV n=1 Tax=unclassified Endozoicomonas TaxID=2644528 RepID=UPI003BB07B5C